MKTVLATAIALTLSISAANAATPDWAKEAFEGPRAVPLETTIRGDLGRAVPVEVTINGDLGQAVPAEVAIQGGLGR